MIGYAGVTYESPPDHPHGCDFGCGLLFWISFNLVKSNGSFAYVNGTSPYLSHYNYGIASKFGHAVMAIACLWKSCFHIPDTTKITIHCSIAHSYFLRPINLNPELMRLLSAQYIMPSCSCQRQASMWDLLPTFVFMTLRNYAMMMCLQIKRCVPVVLQLWSFSSNGVY